MIKRYSSSKLVEDFINFPKMDFGVLHRAMGSGEAEVVRPRPGRSPSPGVGRGGGRSAEARAESEPWGRARRSFVVSRVLARVRALGSGGAEFAVFRVLARVRALGSGVTLQNPFLES